MLSELVVKNQQIAEDLEYKMKRKEEEFQELLKEREKSSVIEKSVLESENRVLKEIQNQKMTCEKDRIQFHKTLRNMLLEEIERIEKEHEQKEQSMQKWRQNFESDMGKQQDKLNATIDSLVQEKTILETQLNESIKQFQQ